MRVLHVDHSAVAGGAERSVLELARAQIGQGHQVLVAVGRRGDFSRLLASRAVPWRDLGWSAKVVTTSRVASARDLVGVGPDFLRAVASLRRVIVSWDADVVHAHTRKAQLIATFAVAGLDVALVWHLRDGLPTRPPLRAVVAGGLKRAHHAVALSRWLRRSYLDFGATPRSKEIGLVPSSIDPAGLAGVTTPWLDGEREPIIGYVGQIARWKGPHLLIDAAERMGDVAASFRIVGSVWFPEAERSYGEWLRRRIARSPVSDRIDWLPATASPAEAFQLIDVLVHTSIEAEPFGRVLVEAMVARRPIVAFRNGSTTELLNEESAVFAQPNGESIAAAIAKLISDPGRASSQAEVAVARAIPFRPDAVGRAMAAEYERARR
jgi:glycosyltransferase involved in cell wall biosynthesis